MEFKFSPCRMGEKLEALVSGDILTLNGSVFDFSPLPEGDRIQMEEIDSHWVSSDVERVGGVIRLTLRIPHGADAPQETLFPTNFDAFITVSDGPVPIPAYEVPHE